MRHATALVGAAQVSVLMALAGAAHAAATTTFGSGFKDVPVAAWVLTLVLSTLSGMVALLNRVRDELRANGALRWAGLFVASHMLGSWLAGLMIFLLAIGQGWPESITAVAIIAASFGGAVFIERMAIRWLWQRLGVDVSKPMPLDGALVRTFPATVPTPMRPPERRGQVVDGVSSSLRPPERRRRPKPKAETVSDYTPLDDG